MIVVEKRGRLGNQMFQYAFGLTASRVLRTWHWYDSGELSRYFTVESRPIRLVKYAAVWLLSRVVRLHRTEVATEALQEPSAVLDSLTDRTCYVGFFQSEEFFQPTVDAVRRSFRIRRPHRERFAEKYGELAANGYICAHVRLTDYFTFRDNVTLPPGYYRRALELLDPDLPVVMVSDDAPSVLATFGSDTRVSVESNDEILDFLLLKYATHVIASNSSFAWWGAWLNDAQGRRVVAPMWWFGMNERRELPREVIPSDWTQIPPRCPDDGEWPASAASR